jgi:hypothetical protein
MHHAVELLIKFTLLKEIPESERSDATKRVAAKYRHDLSRLWNEYERKVAPTDVSRFKPVIDNLHRWESGMLRYGGFPHGTGDRPDFG